MTMRLAAIFAALFLLPVIAAAGEGHDAGYEWAQDQGITDPDDCDGNSQSFIEGCEEAAEEAMEEEAEDEEW